MIDPNKDLEIPDLKEQELEKWEDAQREADWALEDDDPMFEEEESEDDGTNWFIDDGYGEDDL